MTTAALIVAINLLLLFIAWIVPFQGYQGAVIIGLIGVILDCLWQLLRLKLLKKTKNGFVGLLILGGLLIRVVSILGIIQIGAVKLRANAVNLLVIVVLTIPVWNVLFARIAKRSESTN
ncbi:MAG TPA: hypothetical protein PLZ08_05235 [Bacillota bacterium]|jgi:hypothetical protein|nr:hypothetical protein [Bacillota bacterium]HOL09800.1 hypothetical protein [Bacillota bacterium]HPO97346.1 hypothetical protein [Bacillota bacterium]